MLRRGIILAIGVLVVSGITIFSIASAEEGLIPSWIKNTAGFWVEDQISDSEFIQALQFMISNGIIQIPTQSEDTLKELEDENEQLKVEITSLKSQLNTQSGRIQDPLKIDFKEYFSKSYGFAFNIPDSWYEKISDENCLLLISEMPKGAGTSLCVVRETKVPMEYGQELLDTIYKKKSSNCRDSVIKVLGYRCEGFTARKLVQVSMDETPSYLISYYEQRWPVNEISRTTHTFWELYTPIKYETTIFTMETVEYDITVYDEIIDEIISSYRFVSKR